MTSSSNTPKTENWPFSGSKPYDDVWGHIIPLSNLPFETPRSEATKFILDMWRLNGIITIKEAQTAYKSLNPTSPQQSIAFIVHRFLNTRGRRIKHGIYQLLTQRHIEIGILPMCYINEKGSLVKTPDYLNPMP
jgi:hypothetical protein